MEKKLLYIDEYRINREILEVEKLKSYTNELWKLLLKFGITDPEALKNPIGSVNDKLRGSFQTNDINIPILNIVKLVNKEKEYQSIRSLANHVVGHKYLDLLVFTDNYFDVAPTTKKVITDKLTPYITDKDEIALANRIEKCINEAFDLAVILGIRLGRTDFLRTFKANRVNGKTILSPGYSVSKSISN